MNTLTLPWRFFQSLNISGRIGLLIALFWIVMAIFGGALAPHNVEDIGAGPLFGDISREFWFGTDYLGRDIFSRVLVGARYSIGLALTAAILASLVGTLLALLAAVAGR